MKETRLNVGYYKEIVGMASFNRGFYYQSKLRLSKLPGAHTKINKI